MAHPRNLMLTYGSSTQKLKSGAHCTGGIFYRRSTLDICHDRPDSQIVRSSTLTSLTNKGYDLEGCTVEQLVGRIFTSD